MRILLSLFAFLATVLPCALYANPSLAASPTSDRPVEIRGVWMDRRSISEGRDEIRRLMAKYSSAGINVIHPEVIFNGYSAYPSSYLPQSDLWHGVDVLQILIEEAHRRGIEVHPWVWVFRAGNGDDRGGILKAHPDWVAVNRDGESLTAGKSYWLCPSHPGVRRLLIGAFRELAARYAIDGLQLDYVRFEDQAPSPYCYNECCRSRFMAATGIDPNGIAPFTEPVVAWHLWREELVNSLVREASEAVRSARPGIVVSAAVASNPDSGRLSFLQDWAHWARNGWVDYLAPMDYTPDTAAFSRRQDSSSKAIDGTALLAPGIGLNLLKDRATLLAEIAIAREKPVSGVTLFAGGYLGDEFLSALREGPFRRAAALPLRDPVGGAKRLASSAVSILGSATPDSVSDASRTLAAAGVLLRYAERKGGGLGYIAPTRPPVFIPSVVSPIPSVDVAWTSAPPVIDGRLDDPAWNSAASASITVTNLGMPCSQPCDVKIVTDGASLYIAFRAHEPALGALRAKVTSRDGAVFTDDSVEVMLQPQGDARYFHFAVNAAGTQFDQLRSDPKWNADWRSATGREDAAWTAEIAIPISALITSTSIEGVEWRVNFYRNRTLAAESAENTCWSPTYGSYHTPSRFGVLRFPSRVTTQH